MRDLCGCFDYSVTPTFHFLSLSPKPFCLYIFSSNSIPPLSGSAAPSSIFALCQFSLMYASYAVSTCGIMSDELSF